MALYNIVNMNPHNLKTPNSRNDQPTKKLFYLFT